jgi:hypothetical protein
VSQGKEHEPNEKDRKTVETMASHGIPHIEIAQVIGLSAPTMYKWYRNELDTGATKANSMVAQSLYQKALGNGNGAVAACIFWLKVRAGWVEPRPEEAMPGRKELQQRAAATAGGPTTEWANDLETEVHPN